MKKMMRRMRFLMVSMCIILLCFPVNTIADPVILEVPEEYIGFVLYDNNDIRVTISSLEYEEGIKNQYNYNLLCENNTSDEVTLLSSTYLDGYKISTYAGGRSTEAGRKNIIENTIYEKDMTEYGISTFNTCEIEVVLQDSSYKEIDKITAMFPFSYFGMTPMVAASTDSSNDERVSALEKENEELKNQITVLQEENEKLKEQLAQYSEEETQQSAENSVEVLEASEEVTSDFSTTDNIEVDEEPKTLIEYTDSVTIRKVQELLNAVGFNCGTPDGIAGNNTKKAISDYQELKGITVTGTVTDELLESLGIAEEVKKAAELEASKSTYDSSYTYDQLARNPDTYIGKMAKISGKVLQVGDAGDNYKYARVAKDSNYDTVIFVTYDKSLLNFNILDDDIIDVYGICMGDYSYETVMRSTITIPWIAADIIELR